MDSQQTEEHCNAINYIFNTCNYINGILILLMIYSSLFRVEKGVLRGKTLAGAQHSSIKSREVRCLKQTNERESKPGGTYLEQRRLEISFHVRFCRVLSSVNYFPGCEANPMRGEREHALYADDIVMLFWLGNYMYASFRPSSAMVLLLLCQFLIFFQDAFL